MNTETNLPSYTYAQSEQTTQSSNNPTSYFIAPGPPRYDTALDMDDTENPFIIENRDRDRAGMDDRASSVQIEPPIPQPRNTSASDEFLLGQGNELREVGIMERPSYGNGNVSYRSETEHIFGYHRGRDQQRTTRTDLQHQPIIMHERTNFSSNQNENQDRNQTQNQPQTERTNFLPLDLASDFKSSSSINSHSIKFRIYSCCSECGLVCKEGCWNLFLTFFNIFYDLLKFMIVVVFVFCVFLVVGYGIYVFC